MYEWQCYCKCNFLFCSCLLILFKNRLKLLPLVLPVIQKSLSSQLLSNASNQGGSWLLRWCFCEFGLSLPFGNLIRKSFRFLPCFHMTFCSKCGKNFTTGLTPQILTSYIQTHTPKLISYYLERGGAKLNKTGSVSICSHTPTSWWERCHRITKFTKTATHWSCDHRAFTHIDVWQIYKLGVRTGIKWCLGWIAKTEELYVKADWTVDAPLALHKAFGSGLFWKRRESTSTSPNWFHMLATTIRFNFPCQEEDKRFPVPHRAGPQETCCDQTFMLWQTAGWPNVSETNGLSAARLVHRSRKADLNGPQ